MKHLILLASVLVHTCLGGLYAWSTFVPLLVSEYALSTAQTQVIFGCLILVLTLSMIIAGRLLGRLGARFTTMAGGLLVGCGYWAAARSAGDFGRLFLGISILTGTGTGFCYVGPLAMCARWFPRRRGLATGITVAGFGFGAVFLAFLAEWQLAGGRDVLEVFGRIGLLYGGLILLAALPLRFPGRTGSRAAPLEFHAVARDRYFWGLFAALFAGTFAGLLVIGNLKPLLLSRGIAPGAAAVSISVFAVGNAAGRILWGWLADRLGTATIPLSLFLLAVALCLSLVLPGSPPGAIIFSALAGVCFGACFVVYAARAGAHYGADHFASIYPLVFLGYGLSGLLGPWAGGLVYDVTGSYQGGLAGAVIVVMAGLGLSRRLLAAADARNPGTGRRSPGTPGQQVATVPGGALES